MHADNESHHESRLEVLAAEATQDPEGTITINLGRAYIPIRVLPEELWTQQALEQVNNGGVSYWAQRCLTPESVADWFSADPLVGEVNAFFDAYRKAKGMTPGESPASPALSRTTPTR
jgi:hypothetical protein